ncbi:MAG: hypothetical protein AAFN93_03830 [Bacteroidota bacterium]
MKNHISITKITVFVASLIISEACKTKPAQKTPVNEVEVIVPCSGSDYFSTGEVFRANSIGESSDQVVSKKKALNNARADMASQVQTTVRAVIDNYVNAREFNNREEIEERFESLNREIINQELQGTKVICEKQTRTTEGTYKSYIALELDPEKMISSYNSRINSDERLKIDYDYEKFKKTFNEEMEKLGR